MDDKELRPLTDDDIDIMRSEAVSIDQTELMHIFDNFSNALMSILTLNLTYMIDDRDRAEIERLKRIIGLCPNEEKFYRCRDKVWNVRTHILNKNANYFIEKDYSKMIKHDEKQKMIENIVEIVKNNFENRTSDEKNIIWKRAAILLECVIQFKTLVKKQKLLSENVKR